MTSHLITFWESNTAIENPQGFSKNACTSNPIYMDADLLTQLAKMVYNLRKAPLVLPCVSPRKEPYKHIGEKQGAGAGAANSSPLPLMPDP